MLDSVFAAVSVQPSQCGTHYVIIRASITVSPGAKRELVKAGVRLCARRC